MVRDLGSENITVNVYLIDGSIFLKRDIPSMPITEEGNLVSFWHEDKILIYPMHLIKRIEFESSTEG